MANPLSFHKNQSHQVDNKGPLNMVVLGSIHAPSALSPLQKMTVSSSDNKSLVLGRRRTIAVGSSAVVLASLLNLHNPISNPPLLHSAFAQQQDELQQQEDRVAHLFQESSPSVVFIKDIELAKVPNRPEDRFMLTEDENAKVEGTGSGFIWDKFGHISLILQVFLVDAGGNSLYREGTIIGFDPSYDLAVLKVDVEGYELKPATLGTSRELHVGQSCFAIGNPYGYENTLTTGVVSGLGREIPSPNAKAIRGAIQTDADINAGNSGGPLIDSYGHVIGVNTATFTRKGTGASSGVNFAIPIDTVVQYVPILIVYGTPYKDRF